MLKGKQVPSRPCATLAPTLAQACLGSCNHSSRILKFLILTRLEKSLARPCALPVHYHYTLQVYDQHIASITVTKMLTGTIHYLYLVNIWLQCPPRMPEDSRSTPQHPIEFSQAPGREACAKPCATQENQQAFLEDQNFERHAQSLARPEKRLAQALQSFMTSHDHDLKPCVTRENPCAALRTTSRDVHSGLASFARAHAKKTIAQP